MRSAFAAGRRDPRVTAAAACWPATAGLAALAALAAFWTAQGQLAGW